MRSYTAQILLSRPIPSLGLSQGASLQDALEAMAERIVKQDELLQREIFPADFNITTDDIKYTGEGFSSTGLGPEAQELEENAKLKIETVKGDSDVELKFSATDFGLPEGAVIASTVVNVSGEMHMGRSEITNTKQQAGTVNIGYARFPVTVDARVVVNVPGKGDIELRKTMEITSDKDINQETPFQITDRTVQKKPTNLTEVLAQTGSRLKSAERKK
jgi:hypothetical protein